MGVSDLSKVRSEKIPPCEFCGEPAHRGVYACPRIKSITFENERDEVTIRFYLPSDGQRVASDREV
jgi:hypothetical protein